MFREKAFLNNSQKYLCQSLFLILLKVCKQWKRNPHTDVSEPAFRRFSINKYSWIIHTKNTCVGVSFLNKVHRCSSKELFLKISQILQESIFVRVFFNKVAGLQNCNFIKKIHQHRHFPLKFSRFLRTPFFTEHLQCLVMTISGFQPATLLKKRLRQSNFL